MASLSAMAQASWSTSIRLVLDLTRRRLRTDAQSRCISLDAMAKASWQEALKHLRLMESKGLPPSTSCRNILCNCMDWQMALLMEPSEEMALNAIISHEDMEISLATQLLDRYLDPVSALWAMARLTVQDPVEIHNAAVQARNAFMNQEGSAAYPKMCWATAALGISWCPEFWGVEQLSASASI